MNMKILKPFCLLFFIGLSSLTSLDAQETYEFKASNKAKLLVSLNDSLVNGFAGGLNNPQIFDLDINGDGQTDLLVFDREGSRWVPFERRQNRWKYNPCLLYTSPSPRDY